MSTIPLPQGAVKASEIFTDNAQEMLGSAIGQDAMQVFEQLRLVVGDSIRKSSYIFYSEGDVGWQQNTINLNANGVGNMVLRLLQTENGFPRTVDCRMNGTAGANGESVFNNITLNNNELLYLELDRATLASSGGSLVIHNAAGGGSIFSGATLKKIALSAISGMPEIASPIGGATQTCYVPIAMCTVIGNQSSVWWIPHGIMWPSIFNVLTTTWSSIASFLGAIIVQASAQTLPDQTVGNLTDLQAALATLTANGGIICIDAASPIHVDQTVTIPSNVWVIGKSWARATFDMAPGGVFVMQSNSQMQNCAYVGDLLLSTGAMIQMGSTQATLERCRLTLNNTTGTVYTIQMFGIGNRASSCRFENVTGSQTNRNGINYSGGDTNVDIDSVFV